MPSAPPAGAVRWASGLLETAIPAVDIPGSRAGSFTISSAPEPGGLALSCLATVGVALVAYRKRRHRKAA
jgi:hypothetical protein